MNLQEYYDNHGGLDAERALAEKAGINDRFCYQCRVGIRNPSIQMCKRIVEASDFKVTLRGLLQAQLEVKNIDRYWNGKIPKK